ncbi:MAG: Rrf2 family transcriptional regulator [Clostridia bacterium]|nr:Rrf2 family transcriptional regulator [Clostridia bacterium]
MALDTRFSMAIQLLLLIALSPEPMSSAQMAESVGTNPSHVRRILGQLSKANLAAGRSGTVGFHLLREPREIDLFTVYCAVSGSDCFHVFDLHQNPSDSCIVGRHIRPLLAGRFAEAERPMQRTLQSQSLADCIADLKERVGSDAADMDESSISDALRQARNGSGDPGGSKTGAGSR